MAANDGLSTALLVALARSGFEAPETAAFVLLAPDVSTKYIATAAVPTATTAIAEITMIIAGLMSPFGGALGIGGGGGKKGDESGQLTAESAICHVPSGHDANVKFMHIEPLGQQ